MEKIQKTLNDDLLYEKKLASELQHLEMDLKNLKLGKTLITLKSETSVKFSKK